MLAVIFISIVVDVTMRQLGAQPPSWTVPLSEYLLLYATLFGAPWVLRAKGHVLVDSFIGMLPAGLASALARLVYLVCASSCFVVTWVALEMTVSEFGVGSSDVRAVLVPKYLLSLPFVVGFSLMGIEFLRFFAGFDSLYKRAQGRG
jgi:TRAP-type C4-dicarboxylate transport system permease small subunit